MSRGLGKMQQEILETLDEAKAAKLQYGGGHPEEPEAGWVATGNHCWRMPEDMYDLRASLKFLATRHGKTSGEDGPRGQAVDSAFAATFARAARRLIERNYLIWWRGSGTQRRFVQRGKAHGGNGG